MAKEEQLPVRTKEVSFDIIAVGFEEADKIALWQLGKYGIRITDAAGSIEVVPFTDEEGNGAYHITAVGEELPEEQTPLYLNLVAKQGDPFSA